MRRVEEPEKAEAAAIFYERYIAASAHPAYRRLKNRDRARYESQ
jgi:hypothetical protein